MAIRLSGHLSTNRHTHHVRTGERGAYGFAETLHPGRRPALELDKHVNDGPPKHNQA